MASGLTVYPPTELVINNGQGCSHFISPKINFNDVRWDRCALPGPGDQQQTNTAEATGTALGTAFNDSDSQSILVSSGGTTNGANASALASASDIEDIISTSAATDLHRLNPKLPSILERRTNGCEIRSVIDRWLDQL